MVKSVRDIRAKLAELQPRELGKHEGITWARSPAEYVAEAQGMTQALLRLNIEATCFLLEKIK